MANARALDKRRKSIRNIRKITRTMELIATARYKKAMERAQAATAYTDQITKIVSRLAAAGLDVKHPLLEQREETKNARVLVLSSNRGLCGGYNAAILREAVPRINELRDSAPGFAVDVSGKRGVDGLRFRGVEADEKHLNFEDQPPTTTLKRSPRATLHDTPPDNSIGSMSSTPDSSALQNKSLPCKHCCRSGHSRTTVTRTMPIVR